MSAPIVSVGPSKWDTRFVDLAHVISVWSKDPSTQVGAVIVDTKRRIIATGYNGFPRGVVDNPQRYDNRDLKKMIVVHAEVNAIVSATGDLEGSTLYVWPCPVCSICAGPIIQAGIKRVVTPAASADIAERYAHSFITARGMFKEAKVEQVDL